MIRKIKGTLVGCDGNAWSVMNHFRMLAIEQGFSKVWVQYILDKAMSYRYENLVGFLQSKMDGYNGDETY